MARAKPWIVPIVVGSVLLTAATLKLFELVFDPLVAELSPWPRWLLITVVDLELAFGLWLWSGAFARACRRLVLILLCAFACVAAYNSVIGAASCGCFGRVTVDPRWVLALDVTMIAAVWSWRPARTMAKDEYNDNKATTPRFQLRHGVLAAVCGITIVASNVAAVAVRGRPMDPLAIPHDRSPVIVLEPEKWIGHRFPLAAHVSDGAELLSGPWKVVLFHHDCPRCLAFLKRSRTLAENGTASERRAIIELPPFADDLKQAFPALLCRVSDNREWFIATPLEVKLVDGTVVEVLLHES